MKRLWFFVPVFAIVAAFIVGCLSNSNRSLPEQVGQAVDQPDELVIYSLEPAMGASDTSDEKTFHGHTILGKTEVSDAATRKKVMTAFRRGVNDHDGSVAGCFLPHHGLKIRTGKSSVEMVICFMCAQVKVYENGKAGESILISTSPRATFNEVLRAAKVPLSKDAE